MAGAGKGVQAAIKAAVKAAYENDKVRAAAGPAVLGVGKTVGSTAFAKRTNRRRAVALARQIQGKFSDGTIVANRERIVVWKDGKALHCFPPLTVDELQGATLNDRDELQDFNPSLLKDPPPLKPKG